MRVIRSEPAPERTRSRGGIAWAGIASGPTAWALSTQVNYALTWWSCAHRAQVVPFIAAALVLLALAGGVLSGLAAWRRDVRSELAPEVDGYPRSFLAVIGVIMAVLFALVIAVQGSAGLIFTGCER